MHPCDSLQHDLVALGLSGAVEVARVGNSMVRLGLIGITEGLRNTIVEILYTLHRSFVRGPGNRCREPWPNISEHRLLGILSSSHSKPPC